MLNEQRKNMRFLAQDNIIVALRNDSTKIGEVKDTSKGGLSFEHVYEKDSGEKPFRKNLFLWANEFSMANVPCRVIYDILVPTPNLRDMNHLPFVSSPDGVGWSLKHS